MTEIEALEQLRTFAEEMAIGVEVSCDRVIQAGLDALLAGVESPSLALLAGLFHWECEEAGPLFDQVVAELGLTFHQPANETEARWALLRWWAARVVNGSPLPDSPNDSVYDSAALAFYQLWGHLEHTKELDDAVGWSDALHEWNAEHWECSREEIVAGLVEAARALLVAVPRPEQER
jgi:hypothetical protein